jgi:hypothetical protein
LSSKGFLLRDTGHLGAIASGYSSLYLWRQDEALRDFLTSGRYRSVTDSFGRADIETRIVLDARKGAGGEARFAEKEEIDIPLDADLEAVFTSEIERNRDIAERSGTIAAAVGVDTGKWRLTRVRLSSSEPTDPDVGTSYEILHLARPLLDTLPRGAAGK